LFDPVTRTKTPLGPWPPDAVQARLDPQKRTLYFVLHTRDADIWMVTLGEGAQK